jgi:hypothetical protein
MENVVGGRAQEWKALARRCEAGDVDAFSRAPRSTRLGSRASQGVGVIFSSRTANKLHNHAKPQDGPRFTGCDAARSARKLSDTECAPLLRESPTESMSGDRAER